MTISWQFWEVWVPEFPFSCGVPLLFIFFGVPSSRCPTWYPNILISSESDGFRRFGHPDIQPGQPDIQPGQTDILISSESNGFPRAFDGFMCKMFIFWQFLQAWATKSAFSLGVPLSSILFGVPSSSCPTWYPYILIIFLERLDFFQFLKVWAPKYICSVSFYRFESHQSAFV